MFLKLTRVRDNKKVRINIENIVSYYEEPYKKRSEHSAEDILLDGTMIIFQNGATPVKETSEQIDRLLLDSYITIKEAYENRIGEIPQHPTNYQVNDREQLQS